LNNSSHIITPFEDIVSEGIVICDMMRNSSDPESYSTIVETYLSDLIAMNFSGIFEPEHKTDKLLAKLFFVILYCNVIFSKEL
jgi:hypothetical protein